MHRLLKGTHAQYAHIIKAHMGTETQSMTDAQMCVYVSVPLNFFSDVDNIRHGTYGRTWNRNPDMGHTDGHGNTDGHGTYRRTWDIHPDIVEPEKLISTYILN